MTNKSTAFQRLIRRTAGNAPHVIVTSLRLLLRLLLAPWKIFVAVKRSLTSASVTLMLIAFMSLNIVWGYPWTGMLAACTACLFVGWVANWLTRVKINAGCSLPTNVPVGQPLRVTAHLTNTSRLPALDTLVAFDNFPTTRSERKAAAKSEQKDIVVSAPKFYPLIRSGQRIEFKSQLSFGRRGVHRLPPLVFQSTFPFYLFRWRTAVLLDAEIAVTPIPLDAEHHHAARRVLMSVGGWARRLLAGEASEYVGSREYQSGMPVRRWDFVSWARLGRPIVREYQSPTVRSMNLVVDTAVIDAGDAKVSAEESFEYLMSMTVSVLNMFSGSAVSVQLFLADEMLESEAELHAEMDQEHRRSANAYLNDRDSQLTRLARSKSVDASIADSRILAVVEQLGRDPTLLLTRRPVDLFESLSRNVSVFDVGMGANGDPGNVADGRGSSEDARRGAATHSDPMSRKDASVRVTQSVVGESDVEGGVVHGKSVGSR